MREYFPNIKFQPFHIYNRGTEKRIIFLDYLEYCRFIFLMYICRIGSPSINLSKKNVGQAAEAILRGEKPDQRLFIEQHSPLVSFITWNLLPNHFHFVLMPLVEGGISRFMAKIANAYTKYFNTRHQRSGRLFQSSYQSIAIKNTSYFYKLIRYVNLNHLELIEPQWKERIIHNRTKAEKFIDSYEHSAHQDFLGYRHSLLFDRELISNLFGAQFIKGEGIDGYREFIQNWLIDDFQDIKKFLLEK